MTHREGKILVICGEASAKCEDCGAESELRPYGKNGANVCFVCAMKDEENVKRLFLQRLTGGN